VVYDAARKQVVLFGGVDENGEMRDDTWILEGAAWKHLSLAVSPSPRTAAVMAYDSRTQEVVLFGGEIYAGGMSLTEKLNDTWIWDGVKWSQRRTDVAPIARVDAGRVYDAARGRTVLFGGYGEVRGGHQNDTWTWDGETWTEQQSSESPRPQQSPNLVYDGSRKQVVMFAGLNSSGNIVPATWIWNGVEWTQLRRDNSPTEVGTVSAYDATHSVVAYSTPGDKYATPESQTWLWDGKTWTFLK